MTYNVFGGTLNPAQFNSILTTISDASCPYGLFLSSIRNRWKFFDRLKTGGGDRL